MEVIKLKRLDSDDVTYCFDITPKLAALWFCEMSSQDQAECLVEIARITKGWDHGGVFQWQYIRKSLTPEALKLLNEFKDYVEVES